MICKGKLMARLTKRKLQAIETKNKIYEIGIKLIELKGFENTTIDEISKKSNVSVGAFYHYFRSKDDILYKLFEDADEFIKEKAIDSINNQTAVEKIIIFFDNLAKLYVFHGPGLIKALYKTQTNLFLCNTSIRFTMLNNIVTMGIEQGMLDPSFSAEDTTKFLFTGARGVAFNWCLDNGKSDLIKDMNAYISRLMKAITK